MKYIKMFENFEKFTFKNLENKLLSIGGEFVVETLEEDLDKLMTRGQEFISESRLVKMRESRCHQNVTYFYKNYIEENSDRCNIVTGWALSDDGYWRQHSWIYLSDYDEIIETTEKRKTYFGFILNDKETEEFIFFNW